QIAERTINYRRWEAAGRHVIDTWMLAQLHDAGARDLPGCGLKDLAPHFGVAAPDRTYIDASRVAQTLREDPERLMAYAIDDAVETLGVAAVLAPPYFAQAQVVPFDYQACTLRGAAAKIDALMLREYLHRRHAVRAPAVVQGPDPCLLPLPRVQRRSLERLRRRQPCHVGGARDRRLAPRAPHRAGRDARRSGHGWRLLRPAAGSPAGRRRRPARTDRRRLTCRNPARARRPVRGDVQLQDENLCAPGRARAAESQGFRVPLTRHRAFLSAAHRG